MPLGRMGQPDAIFDAILFLLSDSESYITGTFLHVEGGSRNLATAA